MTIALDNARPVKLAMLDDLALDQTAVKDSYYLGGLLRAHSGQ